MNEVLWMQMEDFKTAVIIILITFIVVQWIFKK